MLLLFAVVAIICIPNYGFGDNDHADSIHTYYDTLPVEKIYHTNIPSELQNDNAEEKSRLGPVPCTDMSGPSGVPWFDSDG